LPGFSNGTPVKWPLRILGGCFGLILFSLLILFLAVFRPGHGHFVTEIVMDRPAPQVFRWLSDDERVKKWVGGIADIKTVSSPPNGGQVGRKLRIAEDYRDQRVEMDMEVLQFEQDRSLGLLISSVGDPRDGFTENAEYTLTEQNGKTRLRFDVRTRYPGFILRLFEPIITTEAKAKVEDDFKRLKSLVEAEPPSSR
jgi:uncharacterized protein YndB with AHSA1/START domain